MPVSSAPPHDLQKDSKGRSPSVIFMPQSQAGLSRNYKNHPELVI
jgi:hypothetical protein